MSEFVSFIIYDMYETVIYQRRSGVSFGGGSGKGTYWETGEPKFLEKTIKRTNEILSILKRATGLK